MSAGSAEAQKRRDRTPLVEVNVTHEHGPAPSRQRLTEAVEVITANHVYVLDAQLTCVAVRKTSSGDPVTDSGFLGSRLVGGQLNTDDATEISYPFPRPGAVGVFETARGRARQFHHTSPVRRVVLRLSILTVTSNRVMPTWEEISQATRPPE
jgi:hypothetical protein